MRVAKWASVQALHLINVRLVFGFSILNTPLFDGLTIATSGELRKSAQQSSRMETQSTEIMKNLNKVISICIYKSLDE